MSQRKALLSLRGVAGGYGQIIALKGIDLSVEAGQIVALIGNNGAGKTTTLRTISGLVRARRGAILFKGGRIDRLPPHQIVRLGIAHVPEGRGIFARLSVQENLEMGAFARKSARLDEDLERILAMFPRLKDRRRQAGGTLSGGEQQMLAIGRALMARPSLLLLDEPSMGLSPILVETIFATIEEINRQSTAVLLVEQNAHLALNVAHRGYVLESGRIVAEATAEVLRADPAVRKAYLGED